MVSLHSSRLSVECSEDRSTINGQSALSRLSLMLNEITHRHVIYYCQVVVIYAIIITCLLNLSLSNDKDCTWTTLLSACIGYLLRPPKIKKNNDTLLPHSA